MMIDPELDLVLQRDLPIPPDAVWRAWTEPDLLKQWFTPRPWRTTDAELDLRPGGIFRTVMQGPDREEGGGTGCILEVVPGRRLVWTGALLPGFRPAVSEFGVPVFTAVIEMEPDGNGDALHGRLPACRLSRSAGARGHGLRGRLGAALDQLVEAHGRLSDVRAGRAVRAETRGRRGLRRAGRAHARGDRGGAGTRLTSRRAWSTRPCRGSSSSSMRTRLRSPRTRSTPTPCASSPSVSR